MIYMKVLIRLLLLFIPLVAGATPRLTIVNDEMSPLYITSGTIAEIPEAMTLDEAHAVISRLQNHIVVIAPGNMVPYDLRGSELIGYYGGSAAAVAFHAVRRSVPPETIAVRIDRRSFLQHNRRPVIFSTDQLPENREPIILGAGSTQWRGTEELFVLSEIGYPIRVENIATGREIPFVESSFWNVGGTQVEQVRFAPGERAWYLRLQTEPPIMDGTGYHFALYNKTSPSDASYIGELVALQAGQAGPVIFRNGSTLGWVGQYLRQDGVIEIQVDRAALADLAPHISGVDVDVVFATSHRREGQSERFTMDTLTLPLHQ
jgi:hypothetical protein